MELEGVEEMMKKMNEASSNTAATLEPCCDRLKEGLRRISPSQIMMDMHPE